MGTKSSYESTRYITCVFQSSLYHTLLFSKFYALWMYDFLVLGLCKSGCWLDLLFFFKWCNCYCEGVDKMNSYHTYPHSPSFHSVSCKLYIVPFSLVFGGGLR
jgi:hypothetical protein